MSIASPCINVCRMDATTGLCEGCFRTLPEIAGWSRSGDAEKLRVLDLVAERRARFAQAPARTAGETEGA